MTKTDEIPTFRSMELPGGVRLAVNSNRKLKTIQLKIWFAADLDETVTARSLVPLILRRGTRSLPNMQSISRHLDGLYGASVSSGPMKVGEWHITRYSAEVVNDRYLPRPEGLLEQVLEFTRELLTAPRSEGSGFVAEWVRHEKESLRRTIESLIDDKAAWATHRAIEEMCPNEPYRLGENGRVEDIDALDPVRLFELHRHAMRTLPMAVYIMGDIDEDDAASAVSRSLSFERDAPTRLRRLPTPYRAPAEPRRVEETLEVQQARLVIGFRHGVTYSHDDYETLLVMNGVLGAFGHSKLFQNVREKAGLAYSASSWLERTKGLLFITSGIASEKEAQASTIILEQIRALQEGEITDAELESTIHSILTQNEMLEDNYSALAAVDYTWGLHGRPMDFVAFRERIQAVSKDDVARVAQLLVHDTTYFLHG
jgi:predicted Zn-dependent peptidase